jgi:hypothetical protein
MSCADCGIAPGQDCQCTPAAALRDAFEDRIAPLREAVVDAAHDAARAHWDVRDDLVRDALTVFEAALVRELSDEFSSCPPAERHRSSAIAAQGLDGDVGNVAVESCCRVNGAAGSLALKVGDPDDASTGALCEFPVTDPACATPSSPSQLRRAAVPGAWDGEASGPVTPNPGSVPGGPGAILPPAVAPGRHTFTAETA